ncbi:glgB [Acrasis kona]|uniref:GlgB n=1 Tax=Acrasis kona TaxID=1008807 RepID=A0AAW2YJ46_9EUKA
MFSSRGVTHGIVNNNTCRHFHKNIPLCRQKFIHPCVSPHFIIQRNGSACRWYYQNQGLLQIDSYERDASFKKENGRERWIWGVAREDTGKPKVTREDYDEFLHTIQRPSNVYTVKFKNPKLVLNRMTDIQ